MKADSIIYGNIVTLDTDNILCEAMVVKNGIIVYVGSKDIANTMIGKRTKILDYGNCFIYPGFMDAHTHGPLAAERLALQAQLVDQKSMQDYIDIMRKYVEDNPDKKYYLGSGFDMLGEANAAMLDEICPDKPMVLRTSDGHTIWTNTACMKECGVDRKFAEFYGPAEVHVDKDGNPTGVFCEKPLFEITKRYETSLEDMKKALLVWQKFAFSQGITAVGEAYPDMSPICIEAYDELVKEGKWKLRTYAYAVNKDTAFLNPEKTGEKLKELADKYNSEYFKITGQKIILDGVVEAHTAAMIDEYSDQKGYYGVLNIKSASHLKKIVESCNKAGFPVHTHAIGDKAAKMILDAYEAVETETCNFDIRNVICHLQCIRKEDIKRCGDYNVISVVAPTWAPILHPDFDNTLKYLGPERAWSQYPLKSFEDAGATICFHTDYPINTIINAPMSIYSAVKRALPIEYCSECGVRSVFLPDEAISSLRALLAMSANIAYMFNEERRLGKLQIGMIANASVYNKDFVDYAKSSDIMKAKLVATIVDGEEVYHS